MIGPRQNINHADSSRWYESRLDTFHAQMMMRC